MQVLDERDPGQQSQKRHVYVVSAMPDGCWCIGTAPEPPWLFATQVEAEDYAIALALRSIPSVVRVRSRDGTLQREIRYE